MLKFLVRHVHLSWKVQLEYAQSKIDFHSILRIQERHSCVQSGYNAHKRCTYLEYMHKGDIHNIIQIHKSVLWNGQYYAEYSPHPYQFLVRHVHLSWKAQLEYTQSRIRIHFTPNIQEYRSCVWVGHTAHKRYAYLSTNLKGTQAQVDLHANLVWGRCPIMGCL